MRTAKLFILSVILGTFSLASCGSGYRDSKAANPVASGAFACLSAGSFTTVLCCTLASIICQYSATKLSGSFYNGIFGVTATFFGFVGAVSAWASYYFATH